DQAAEQQHREHCLIMGHNWRSETRAPRVGTVARPSRRETLDQGPTGSSSAANRGCDPLVPAHRVAALRTANRGDVTMSKAALGAAVALAAVALFVDVPSAAAQARREVGRLTCRVGPGIGALVASRRRMACRFDRAGDTRIESYTGTITRFGLDIGATAGGIMTWTVFVRTRGFPPGTLAGHY